MRNMPQPNAGKSRFYLILTVLAVLLTLNFSYAGGHIKGSDRYAAINEAAAAKPAPPAVTKKEEATPAAVAAKKEEAKPAATAAEEKKEEPKAEKPVAKYMGSAVCMGCHKGISDDMKNSFHSRMAKQSTIGAEKSGCESCHGPASLHVNSGGKKDSIVSYKVSKQEDKVNSCLACHSRGSVMQFGANAHNMNNISCDSCHKIHTKKDNADWKAEARNSCAACHRDVEMETKLPSRHPVRDGRMSCADCHNAHGAGEKMLKSNTANELCKSCHSQNATAHVYAHPPVNENCMNCHKPHGSANRGLLAQRVPMLCLQCHGNVSQSHDLSARTRQDCTNNAAGCHGDIHGSNSNNMLLK